MEVWKDIEGFENYEVSNLSNVRRKKGTSHLKSKNLKGTPDKDGYIRVNLKVKQKSNTKYLHRLIAESFIPNSENKPQVNHINGIKNDNRIENLEWCTLSENRRHAYDTGLQNSLSIRGEKNNFSKLNKKDIIFIRENYNKKEGRTNKYFAKKYKVSEGCIRSITSKTNWKWVK
jgi:hypothetical protein